jgi:GntR family transcriptional repressor for pyruvate dehydrogenase complex
VFERTWDFHRQLADSAGNAVMAKLLGSLYEMVKASQVRLYSPYVTREQEHEAHMRLLTMLKKRDPEAAYRGMLEHLAAVDEVVKHNMAAMRGPEPAERANGGCDLP